MEIKTKFDFGETVYATNEGRITKVTITEIKLSDSSYNNPIIRYRGGESEEEVVRRVSGSQLVEKGLMWIDEDEAFGTLEEAFASLLEDEADDFLDRAFGMADDENIREISKQFTEYLRNFQVNQ